jgi:hypothetical protein
LTAEFFSAVFLCPRFESRPTEVAEPSSRA